jgi:hypothetical protein
VCLRVILEVVSLAGSEAEPAGGLLRGIKGPSPAAGLPRIVATRCDSLRGLDCLLSLGGSTLLYLSPQAVPNVT